MHTISTPNAGLHQLLPMQRLADARRVLEINLDANPFAQPEDRLALRQAKRAAWVIIADVCEQLVETLDVVAGDPDLEPDGDELDGNGSEDDFMDHPTHLGPGCPIADPDAAVDDSACDEPNMDLEPEEGR